MSQAQINIRAHGGALQIELSGPQRGPSTLVLGDGGAALVAMPWGPLRWATSASLGGLIDPIGWLESGAVQVHIDDAGRPARGLRKFDVTLEAVGGRTPLALRSTAEVPSWVVGVGKWIAGCVWDAQDASTAAA